MYQSFQHLLKLNKIFETYSITLTIHILYLNSPMNTPGEQESNWIVRS